MIPLANEQQESYEKTKIRYICKKKVGTKNTNDKNYREVKNNVVILVNTEVLQYHI